MAKRSIDNYATGLLLAGLGLCALLMSGTFFLHARHATDGHLEAAAAKARALPGVTLMDGHWEDGHPGVIVTSTETDGQAARLGISVGDGVISLDGTPISSLDQASSYLLHHPQPRIALGLKHADHIRTVMLDRPERDQ